MALKETQKNWLFQLINYFVHERLRSDSDRLYQARILIGALLACSIPVLGAAFALLLGNVGTQSKSIGIAICSTIFVGLSMALLGLRRNGNYEACKNRAITLIFVMVFLGVCVAGGPGISPATQLVPVLPLIAFFFGGARSGGIVVLASLATTILLVLLRVLGFEFMQTMQPQAHEYNRWVCSFVGFFAISGLAYIYEFTTANLKRERDKEHRKAIQLAQTDALTGLANRRTFEAELLERMASCRNANPPDQLTLGCFDLNGFKFINDQYGHGVGDEVLLSIAQRLQNSLREIDFVSRHGGDEFMLILSGAMDQAYLEQLAQRLLASIEQPISTSAGLVSASGSIGFAELSLDDLAADALKRAADAAMYIAKRSQSGWHFHGAPRPVPVATVQ